MYDRTAYGFALSGVCKIEETGEIIDLQEVDFAEQQFIEGISVTELYIGGEVDSWGDQIEKKHYIGGAVIHNRMVEIPANSKFKLEIMDTEDESIKCYYESIEEE